MISLDRRNAFTRTFSDYPKILVEVATRQSLLVPIVSTNQDEGEPPETVEEVGRVFAIYVAQFLTRLVQTRCRGTSAALENFAEETIKRYKDFYANRLPGHFITASKRHNGARNAFEQQMSDVIFTALAEEARIIEAAAAEGNLKPDEEWNETDFWTDVMLAFAPLSPPGMPKITTITAPIFLDHRAEFTAALNVNGQ